MAGPPGNLGPALIQYQTYQTAGSHGETLSHVKFNTPTAAGDTIWVVVTLSDFAGAHSLAISDTQGNTYTLLDQENDGAPGSQTVAQFYASAIAGDTNAPDTVTLTSAYENYRGLLIAEVAGTAAPSLVGTAGNIQDGLPAGPSNITSTPISIAAAQAPALLLALSMNTTGGSSDTGGSGDGGPAAGAGFTQIAQFWNWGLNLATFEAQAIPAFYVAGAGGPVPPPGENVAALFNAPDTDSYVTVAAIFSPSIAPVPPPAAAPAVSITASANAIATGESTTLKWATRNATRCAASGAWSGTQPVSGSITVTPAATSSYVLSCSSAGGSAAAQSVLITVGGAAGPALVQYNTHQTSGMAGENDSAVAFQSPTHAGDTIWVAVTVSDYAAVPTIAITDTQGNRYTLLDQKNDGYPGYQSVAHFYAANIAGDTRTPDVINVVWPWDGYKGVVVAEIAGTAGAPESHRANIQDGLAAGADNVTSGTMLLASPGPALLLALSMNTSGGSSDLGGSGYGAPAAGQGFTQIGTMWNWGVNLATLESASVASLSSTAARFDAPDTDSYVTVAAVFR